MKLQVQYNRISIVSSIIVLLIAGIGYYFLLHYILVQQLDDTLRVEEVEIRDYIQKNKKLPEATTFKDQRIGFEQVGNTFPQRFSTLKIYHEAEKMRELSRQLVFPVEVNGTHYAATVTKSQEATEALIGVILLITLGLILLLGVLLFFANKILLKRLWKPFRKTLSSIKDFDLDAPSAIKTEKTSIHEFNELNESIHLMTDKVVKDYLSLKHFTDHASHEMQTPLAIVNSRLDILIQDPSLTEKNLTDLQVIYNAVNKMSKLGQSLLLLTRIDNNQFSELQTVNISELVINKLAELEELIQSNSLQISTEINELSIKMNRHLADMLINNLIINAITHSNKQEEINIRTTQNSFTISNPGSASLNAQHIFDRFWKSPDSEGTGLGLAIVKEICEQYDFSLLYNFNDQRHFFIVKFAHGLFY